MYSRAFFNLSLSTVTSLSYLYKSYFDAPGSVFLSAKEYSCSWSLLLSLFPRSSYQNAQLLLSFLCYLQLPLPVAGTFLGLPLFQHYFFNFFQLIVLCIHRFQSKRQVFRFFQFFTVNWRQESNGETRNLFNLLFLKGSYETSGDFRRLRYINKRSSKALGLQPASEVWTSSLRRTESGGLTFQGINVTTKSRRNRAKLVWAVEKSSTQWSLDANDTPRK